MQVLTGRIHSCDIESCALPGKNGNTPVIRLALTGAETLDDAQLMLAELLHELKKDDRITGPPPDIVHDEGPLPPDSLIGKIRQNAGLLAGLTWEVSEMMLLYSAINDGKLHQDIFNKEKGEPLELKVRVGDVAMATSFALSDAMLMKFTGGVPRRPENLMSDLSKHLEEINIDPLADEEIKRGQSIAERLTQTIKRYPWETAAAINTAGAAINFGTKSSRFVKRFMEDRHDKGVDVDTLIDASGALASTGAALIQLLVPQRNGDRMIDVSGMVQKITENPVYEKVASATHLFPPAEKTQDTVNHILENLVPHKHPTSAFLNTLNHSGRFFTAMSPQSMPRDDSETKNPGEKNQNYFQAASAVVTGLGYGIQALAEDMERLEPEQAAFCCALMMHEKLRETPEKALNARARKLSHAIGDWLENQTDITKNWETGPAEQLFKTWESMQQQREANTCPPSTN